MAGPASIRANNPANIKTGVGWLGVCGTTGVAAGVNDVFATPVYGARAMAKNIQAKFDGRASNTNELMNILSPTSENNTNGYVIPSVVNYMNQNGYPNFTQYTPIIDSFTNDRAFGTTFMQAITYMEQAGSEKAFPREVLEAGWDAKDKKAGEFDANQFGDGSQNGFEGCNGEFEPPEEEGDDQTTDDLMDQVQNMAQQSTAPASGAGGEFGFKDPDLAFPVVPYEDEQTTNFAARGQWQPALEPPEGNPFKVPESQQPEYPHNKVIESTNPNVEERHRIEIDDTPKQPRVTIAHRNGSGIEMLEEEGLVVVNSKGRCVQLVGQNFEMFVEGNGDVIYKGSLNLTVEGDMNLKVKGNMNTYVEGNKTEIVEGDKATEVWQDNETTVSGHTTSTTAKISTELVLGSKNSFVKGKQSNWVEGNIEMLSGATTHLSAETKISAGSPIINMAAQTAQIHALAGNIGGPGVYHYGAAWDGTLNVIGDVNVKTNLDVAGTTILGDTLEVNDEIIASGDITAFDTTEQSTAASMTDASSQYLEPTGLNISLTLTATDEGISAVNIDPGQKLLQEIDLRQRLSLAQNRGPQR